jgi:hypothetical protein
MGLFLLLFLPLFNWEGLGALSGALVCRQRHDKYAVVSEKKLLLTGTRAEVDSYLENGAR